MVTFQGNNGYMTLSEKLPIAMSYIEASFHLDSFWFESCFATYCSDQQTSLSVEKQATIDRMKQQKMYKDLECNHKRPETNVFQSKRHVPCSYISATKPNTKTIGKRVRQHPSRTAVAAAESYTA